MTRNQKFILSKPIKTVQFVPYQPSHSEHFFISTEFLIACWEQELWHILSSYLYLSH